MFRTLFGFFSRPAACGALLLLGFAQVAAADDNLPKPPVSYRPDVRITLKTNIGPKGMTFQGVGDSIDGLDDPTLQVPLGAVVQITLIDGDGAEHNLAVPD
ncbi:MAG TPA: nitrite reductase, copper-containing, partial [Gammaproteobacteria bacterium]|nr:nitrite reductase, copper-containing [Gammaproteobacteria bacterium]